MKLLMNIDEKVFVSRNAGSTFRPLSVEQSTQSRQHRRSDRNKSCNGVDPKVFLNYRLSAVCVRCKFTFRAIFELRSLSKHFQKLTICMVIKAGCVESLSESDDCSEQSYEDTPLCQSRKHHINPDDLIRKSSPDEHWEFDKNFSQKIEVEVCVNAGAPCTDYPLIKTKCRQKFLSIQLQVFSKNSTRSQLKTFSIPSYCECVFYRQ